MTNLYILYYIDAAENKHYCNKFKTLNEALFESYESECNFNDLELSFEEFKNNITFVKKEKIWYYKTKTFHIHEK